MKVAQINVDVIGNPHTTPGSRTSVTVLSEGLQLYVGRQAWPGFAVFNSKYCQNA